MTRAASSLAVLLCLAAVAGAEEPFASLAPVEDQDAALLPYRLVTAAVTNPAAQTGRALEVAPDAGGPAVLVPAWLPPSEEVRVSVPLPALSVRQACRVRVLAAAETDAEVLAETQADVEWDEAMLTIGDFIRPRAYGGLELVPPAWPRWVRPAASGIALLAAAAMAGLLLPERFGLRVALLLALAAAGTVFMAAMLSRARTVAVTEADGLVVVSGRRSTVWRHAGGDLAPLYVSESLMRSDRAVLIPDRQLRVPLTAGEVRVFARCGAD